MANDDAIELMPCPFCDAEHGPPRLLRGGGLSRIMCWTCNAQTGLAKTEAEVIAAWNTRLSLSRNGWQGIDGEAVEVLRKALVQVCAYVREAIDDGALDAIVALDAIDAVACTALAKLPAPPLAVSERFDGE